MKKQAGLFAALAAAVIVGLGGCSSGATPAEPPGDNAQSKPPVQQIRRIHDTLEGVKAIAPDSAFVILNADRYPNVSVLCLRGTAIVTTTRQDGLAPQIQVISPGLTTLCQGEATPTQAVPAPR